MQNEGGTAASRPQIHGYLSEEARAGWYRFAERHGTNVSALLEALGLALDANRGGKKKALPPLLKEVVGEARAIASARSGRGRGVGAGGGISSRRP